MTDEDLNAWEARCARNDDAPASDVDDLSDAVRPLIAEVRRLRGVIEDHRALAAWYRDGMRTAVDGGEPGGDLKALLDALAPEGAVK